MVNRKAFTLVELIITIAILAVLAMVALPTFGNLQKQVKDSAVKGAVGAMREAIQLYRINEITSKRQPGTPGVFPDNGCPDCQVTGTEQACVGQRIMENGIVPDNPWARGVKSAGRENWVAIASTAPKGSISPEDAGWIYDRPTCDIWANTTANGGVDDPNDPTPTENWF